MALFVRVWQFYRLGFKQMRLGRTLWKIILIKLFVLFVVVKLLILPTPPTNEEQQQRLMQSLQVIK